MRGLKTLIASASIVVSALVVPACNTSSSRQYAARGTDLAAGADVKVEVKSTEANNFMVEITAEHLTPPERLGENLEHYVVWFRQPGEEPRPQGVLQYDASSRTGRLTATTVQPRFEIIITAEQNTTVTAPSGDVVASMPVDAG